MVEQPGLGTLRIRLFGPLEVDGLTAQQVGSRKARTLLRALALGRGAPVSSDRLVDACWRDDVPERAPDQLAVLVSRLRRVLGRERVVHSDAGYALRADWLDLDEVEALEREARSRREAGRHTAAHLAAASALSLVRGPLLADEPEAPWADIERARAQRLVARLRHLAAETALGAGDVVEAIEVASAALDHDPYDEHALRLLMAALRAGGRPAAALLAYARCRERLAEDLGVDPAAETEAVHAAVLRDEPIPGLPVAVPNDAHGGVRPGRPVSARGPVVGREPELAAFAAAFDRAVGGRSELIEVEGEGGIGKTALLDAWAQVAAGRGATVVRGTCGAFERLLPLQSVVDAIAGALRGRDDDVVASVLGPDRALLDPLMAPVARTDGPVPVTTQQAMDPAVLFRALTGVLARLAAAAPLVVLLDDVHMAGATTVEWLRFVIRPAGAMRVLVVAARRPGEGPDVPATARVVLGPLGRAAVAAIVGDDRADELHARSGGHPLFLTELAAGAAGAELPASIVEIVDARCAAAGAAAHTLRAAAVLGAEIDLDLLAAVLSRQPVELLDHVDEGVRRRFLDERGTTLAFRHDLVREALARGVSATRAAVLHRAAGRALSGRVGAEPLEVARHARLGGDDDLVARALIDASRRAAERGDHDAAQELLDESLALRSSSAALLARARLRALTGRYRAAVDDAVAALDAGAGAPAMEAAGWAHYWARDFDAAQQFADDAVRIALDSATRASALVLAGRTRHASGDLAGAEERFVEALGDVEGPGAATTSVWLGVLRSHQSRSREALDLMRVAARPRGELEQLNARLHAMLFTGHALALAGRPAEAIDALAGYTAEVERQRVTRYVGRGENFTGWVLRNVGAVDRADDANLAALDLGRGQGNIPETEMAALLDLAEAALGRRDPDAAGESIELARVLLPRVRVFAWRLELKLDLLDARRAFDEGRFDAADAAASALAASAQRLGVPRYTLPARILAARSRARQGLPVDHAQLAHDVDALPGAVALEAWWLTALAARDTAGPWWGLAADRVDALASRAGAHGETLRRYARDRFAGWQGG